MDNVIHANTLDTLTPEERSERMARVRNKDTKPELAVRRLLYSLGYRYRLQGKNLPGKPDIVFASRKKVIFVHGCFWHRHAGCARCRTPKSRPKFWIPKLAGNLNRDIANQAKLRELGWDILILWECEIAKTGYLRDRVIQFLENQS